MATALSINIRKEAAMRSMEKSLSHFGDFGTFPRRHRYPKMLHVIQLEMIAEFLAAKAEDIANAAIDAENEDDAIERRFQAKAEVVMGKRKGVGDGTNN